MGYMDSRYLSMQYKREVQYDSRQLVQVNCAMSAARAENAQQSQQLTNSFNQNKAQIENKYAAQISSLNAELAQAQANGDTTKVSQLQAAIKELETEKANAIKGLETMRDDTSNRIGLSKTQQEAYWESQKEYWTDEKKQDEGLYEQAKQMMQEALNRMFPKQSTTTT